MVQLKKRKKILIIDDEASIRSILKEYLSDIGPEVHEAEDGAIGFLKYKKAKYDLLIVDLTMPKVSGQELIKNIRTADQTTKILVLTSCAEREVIEQIIACGVQGWILKPFDEAAFKTKVEKLLT